MSNDVVVFNPNQQCWQGMLDEVTGFFKKVMKECWREILEEHKGDVAFQNKTITSEELCKRWNICKTTLRNKELDGLILPLMTSGRKKIYSMKDVMDVEMSGYFKQAI